MSHYSWHETLNVTSDLLMKNDQRLPVIWISVLDCTGCIEAFIRCNEPSSIDSLFNFISLEYSELLSAASGEQAEEHKESIFEKYKGEYVLAIEGGIPGSDEYLTIAGKSVIEEIMNAAKHAKAVIAIGSCSSWGGIAAAGGNPTNSVDAMAIMPEEVPVALVPGCPPVPEAIIGTLLHVHFHGELPELDKKLRPKVFYQKTVHMTCHRKPYFDQKLFAESFDDEGAQQGYCLFKLGCKGPQAFNMCESYGMERCIASGFPCIACSEKGVWDKGGFYGKKRGK